MTGSWVARDQAIATLSHSSVDHFLPRPIMKVLLSEFRTEHVRFSGLACFDTIPTRNGRELGEIWVSKVGTNF